MKSVTLGGYQEATQNKQSTKRERAPEAENGEQARREIKQTGRNQGNQERRGK